MVCGFLFPCCSPLCGCKAAGYTPQLSFWLGPIAGTYGVGADSCLGRSMIEKWNKGAGGGLPAGCEGRGDDPSHIATFYLTIGDAPSKPGVIHQWHEPDRLTAKQKEDLPRALCMTMFRGADVCFFPQLGAALNAESAIGPNVASVLEAVGLSGQGFELRVEGPPPFMCGREPMYGCVYLDAAAQDQQALMARS